MDFARAMRLALFIVLPLVAVFSTPSVAATAAHTVTVIPLAGEVEEACDELVQFTAGEIRITEQKVVTASGGITHRIQVHSVGATAIGLESGLVYRDHTMFHQQDQFSARWFTTQFEDGSHGVNVVVRIRVFAPGSNASTFVERFDFHLRRVNGLYVDPQMVHERSSQSCT